MRTFLGWVLWQLQGQQIGTVPVVTELRGTKPRQQLRQTEKNEGLHAKELSISDMKISEKWDLSNQEGFMKAVILDHIEPDFGLYLNI